MSLRGRSASVGRSDEMLSSVDSDGLARDEVVFDQGNGGCSDGIRPMGILSAKRSA